MRELHGRLLAALEESRGTALASYSIFDPARYRNHAAKWHFPQENATFNAVKTSTCGSKVL
jgi:hypothetical protein